ncbi:hypothetical protein [Streptomyces atroolivaceus]|uniref:Uncharacterized protein n=1 Tax=Streptomyces atroolivaceus TaxID=66869 RepID=A0ABV9VJT5_STRAZ|nr:hypothetical protein [Streptomyces atroolivaceus]
MGASRPAAGAVRGPGDQLAVGAALGGTVADVLEAEPLAAADGGERETGHQAVGAEDTADRPARPMPRQSGRSHRSLPPN